MNQLDDDSIFSIYLMCSDEVKHISTLMLLNKQWFRVAAIKYDSALWRRQFSLFLRDRIDEEEEKLQNNEKALKNSQLKGKIKKLNDLRKSHVEEYEKLYQRSRKYGHDDGHENGHEDDDGLMLDNFFDGNGSRSYTIFKKEFKGYLIGRNTERLVDRINRTISPNPVLDVLECVKPMIDKWNEFIEHVDKNLKADCPDDLYIDQRHLLQKTCTIKFVDAFEKGYGLMRIEMKNRISTSDEESMIEFRKINSKLIEPIRILTNGKRYKYPLNGYQCLELAVKTMDFGLVKGILDFLVEDNKKDDSQKQVINHTYTSENSIAGFGTRGLSFSWKDHILLMRY